MKDFDTFLMLFMNNLELHYINSHIVENEPDKKELYSKVNFMLYGRWIKCEFGRKREIAGTTQGQIMTFTSNVIEDPLMLSNSIIFETILN